MHVKIEISVYNIKDGISFLKHPFPHNTMTTAVLEGQASLPSLLSKHILFWASR